MFRLIGWIVLGWLVISAGLLTSAEAPAHVDFCAPLPPPSGEVVTVSNVVELVQAVNQATPGNTILLQDGTYVLDGAYLRIDQPNVTLRSASGNREAVILDGNYVTTEIVQVVCKLFSRFHLIHVQYHLCDISAPESTH